MNLSYISAHVTAVCRSGYYQLRQLRQAVRSLSEGASKTLVPAFVSCRLDYCNSLFFGISEDWWTGCSRFRTPPPVWLLAPDAPTTYRRCSVSYTGYRYASASTSRWPHSYTSRCLAFHHRTVPGRRLPSCRRCSWAATAFHSEPNMRSDADIQHLWRQSVWSCRPRTMEQSSVAPEGRWLIVQWIPAVAKDIFVWTVGPRRSVNCINCAV